MSNCKVITISNQKGGVGKTTTCINLGAVLNARGKKVLYCDMDPQGNCSSGLGVDKSREPNIYDLMINQASAADVRIATKYGDLLSANSQLSGASVELVDLEAREYILKNALAEIKAEYDFILIDCPPSLELLTINALAASDSVLIPVQCEYFALEGIRDLLQTIELTRQRIQPELEIEGIVMTMYDKRLNLSQQVTNEVRAYFGDSVYKTVIPRNVRLSEAPSHGKPIVAYDRMSIGARSYYKLANELLQRQK